MKRFNEYELKLEKNGREFKRKWMDRSAADATERAMRQYRGQYGDDLKLLDIKCVKTGDQR